MTPPSLRRLCAGLVAIAVVAGGGLMLAGQTDKPPATLAASTAASAPGQPSTTMPATTDTPTTANAPSPDLGEDGLANLPSSLRGTAVDGRLQASDDGRLVIEHAVRRVFDYFLSIIGEEPADTVLNRLQRYFQANLPASAVIDAEQLLARYLAWQAAAGELGDGAMPAAMQLQPEQMRARLALMESLQVQHLGETAAAAFFGDENRYNRYTLDRLALMARQDLAPAERQLQLQQLRANLPPGMQTLTAGLSQSPPPAGTPRTAAERYQRRAEAFGDEAAQRLQALDQKRAQWDRRLEQWLRQRQQILASSGLDPETQQRRLALARQQHFDEREVRRVQALERLRDNRSD